MSVTRQDKPDRSRRYDLKEPLSGTAVGERVSYAVQTSPTAMSISGSKHVNVPSRPRAETGVSRARLRTDGGGYV